MRVSALLCSSRCAVALLASLCVPSVPADSPGARAEAGAEPGEFVFAESSARAGEDEGYALGFVYDKARDASDLVILDASDMRKPPVATIALPRRVPHGFHGSWIRG